LPTTVHPHDDWGMRVGTTATGSAQEISRLVSANAPVLIFEVDADGSPPARRNGMRLVGKLSADAEAAKPPPRGELSAVLLLRAQTPSRLLSCIRAVTGGSETPPVTELVYVDHQGVERTLTHREFDVLRLLADGSTTREIAEHLSYSERTIKNIVHSLLEKLNCRTRAHAVALAARQGVV
jgi:DNA-binding CsgD family transcriptional regulator